MTSDELRLHVEALARLADQHDGCVSAAVVVPRFKDLEKREGVAATLAAARLIYGELIKREVLPLPEMDIEDQGATDA